MKWSDIERSKKWETMSADQRAAAREQFFDEFIAPKAPDHFDVDDLRTRWMDQHARGEAAKQPGAEGPRSRGGDRTPMTPPQRLASYANAAVRRGVPVREVEDRLGQAFDERGYFREGEAPTSVTADQQMAWTEARAAKVDPFADMSARARNPRGGAPMGYVSTQAEIDEATLTPDEIVAKREAEKIEELRKAAEAEGIRSPLGVAKDSLFGNIGAVADTAGAVARLANKKYRVPFGAEISAGAGLLGKLGVESAQDLSDALEAGVTPRTQFLEDYARSAGNVGAAMREGQSAERKFAQAELAEAVRQGAGTTAKHAFLNPLDMAEMAGESALLMGTGKLAGTAARKAAGASAEVPGMLASEGAMSAASSSEAARNAIASASAEDLAQFPDYEKLAAKYGADGARTVLAGRAGRDAAFAGAVLQALTLGATRKLSAAEEIMAGRFVAPGGRIKNTLTAGGREFLQEAPQGAAEALATNIGEASADSRKDVLAGVGPAGIIEGTAGGIIGGGLGALQKPVTPAAKGVKTAEDILKSAGIDRGLVVPPVDGTSDSDLSAMLAANTLRAARDGYAADPDPDRSAAAQRAAEAFGVSVEELNGADSDSGERTGGSVQADRSGAGAVPVSPDSDIGQRGSVAGIASPELGTAKPVEELTDSAATRRDARRAETLLRAQSGQTVEQVVPQQPQVEIVQEPDSLRSRRDVARAKADFDAYLGEHGVDMAESDRRSAYDGDRVPQPEGEPVAIGPSRIAGKGVLATAPIVEPVTLFDLSADGPVRTDAGRYVNHSPTPNADVKIVQGRIVAVPNREIQAGQELTINYREIDPMREDLATRQHVPLPTAVPVPDFAKEAAADPDKNPEEFGLPKPLKERRLKRTPADFDENYDDALDYLALNGGLNRKAWASEGVDPDMLTRKAGNEWNKRFGLGPTLFPSKGGMTPSEAREKLQGIGFLQPDPESETATIADDDAVQLVMESINQGRKFRLPAGHDVDQRRENILRMADSAAREMEIMRDGEVSPRDIVDANEFDNRERQKPVSAEAIGDEVQPEAEVLRSRIADLELELRTNEITGIPNLRAFNDDAKLGFPVVAAIDMDGLRRLNNTIGHEAADLVLRKLATILDLHKNDGARFYHRSGDEFAARFRDPTEAARTMAELQQNLETVVTRLDGAEQSYDYHGIGISYGLGEDYKHADHNANINKAERLASGAREDSRDSNGTSRRVVPAGVQARRTGDDDGGRSASGDVQYADQAGPVDAQSSGIPAGLDSRKSLATNKLTNRIAKWLGTDFAAEAITLPESLAGALREFGRIFGREVVVFRVTKGRLNANGLRLGDNGALYVNETSQSPALTVAAHELLHEIRQSRPDLYKLISTEVQKRANLVAWRKEMDARELTSGDHRLADSELLEELVADGFGDAMSDPEFLTTLAERNPSKFQQFAKMALEFFDRIIKKMKRIESLGSSDYLTDIKGLRDAYAQMISDYADGVMPSESDGIVKFQAAWHGTPHKVDRFRLDKIGTGEGAQAYGWGMYFASRREVAESYKKALEKREYDIDDPAGIDASFWMQGVTRQQAIQNVESALANPPRSANAKVIADWKADLSYLKSDKPIPQVTKRSGSLYQVDIPEDSDLLDWDKPLSEQPEKVREAILDVMQVNGVRRGEKVPLRAVIDLWGGIEASERMPEMKMTGQGIYHHLIEQSGSAKAASELLNDAGIPGLRYLDGTSRNKGEGSYNYVIWSEEAIGAPSPQFSQGRSNSERDLIVQHNLSAEKLAHAIRMGGLAVPSLAVTKGDQSLTSFGDITLIGDSRLADPKAGAKTFGADIYSPRYPSVEYKLDKFALIALNKALAPYREDGEREIYGGEIRTTEDLAQVKAFKAYAKAQNTNDRYHDYKRVAEGLLTHVNAEERIFDGFTNNGNRRYKPHNIETVIKILKKELRGGENFNYGVGSLRAKFTPQFRSVEQIKKNKGRLVTNEQFETIKKEIDTEFFDIVEQLRPHASNARGFGFADTVISVMEDAAKMGVPRALGKYNIEDVPTESQRAIATFLGKLRDLPTEYFEVKQVRRVGIGEFRAAVVPSGTADDVVNSLKARGLEVVEYEQGNEADRRKVVKSVSESGGLMFSQPRASQGRTQSKSGFFSALVESVEDGKGAPKRGDATTWKQWLDGAQRRGEFKQSERDWLGVDTWLDGRAATTRDELTEFVRANQVEVQEVVLGDNPTATIGRHGYYVAGFGSNARLLHISNHQKARMDDVPAEVRDAFAALGGKPDYGRTKFEQYQLPGGQNYREMLLTLPRNEVTTGDVAMRMFGKKMSELTSEERDFVANEMRNVSGGANVSMRDYRSSHWDQPNILAHVRFNERTDADGKRVLFIEEVQSDWHQAGRKHGYDKRATTKPWAVFDENDGEVVDTFATLAQAEAAAAEKGGRDNGFFAAASDTFADAGITAKGTVPDAPLKKEWPLTAMKRMIRYASENGFDRIAWTTGDQQAERYDLSKQVQSIGYVKNENGTFDVEAFSADGGHRVMNERDVAAAKLSDLVGKEVADKIVRGEGEPARGDVRAGEMSLRGDDLKVGGAGMRAFYDKMLPNELNKYVKKWGGKVGATSIIETDDGVAEYEVVLPNGKVVNSTANRKSAEATARDFDGAIVRQSEGTSVPSLDITHAMRESAMQGQPLFSQPRTPAQAAAENAQKRATVGAAVSAQQPVTFAYSNKFTDDIRGNLRKLRELAQDKMLSALLVQNDIEAARGALSDSVNVYRRENLMHGRSGDQLEQLKRKHVAPLVNAMKAAKVDDAVMEDWLEATFAPERNALIAAKNPAMPDGGSGMTNAEAAAFLAGKTDGYRSGVKLTPEMTKALQSLAPKIAALRTETLTRMVASGEITQDAMDAMQESAPNYVPLRGKDGVEITTGRGVGRGVDVRGKPIKEAHGRGEGNRAENILAELIGDAERSIVQSEKNRVGKTLAKLVLENPNKDLWSIEPVQTEQKTDATGQVYLAVKPNAADQDMIRFMHDGKPYHIKIADKRLREAMKGLGVDNSGAVIRFLGTIQRYFSAVLTRYNPSFIAVNALRDLHFGMTAIIAEHGVKIATKAALNYPVAMRAIWRDERGTGKGTAMDRYAREYTAAGGKTFFAKRDSVEEIAGKLSAEFKGYGKLLRGGQVGLAWNKAISNSAMLKIVNDANDAVENAMRLAAYAALREAGKSVEQSAEYAKNITVNFNRKGQVATAANAIILFYNAAMQGAHRSITLLRNPKVMMAMGGLAGLQAVLAAYAMGADDEDEDGLTAWEKIPPWEKERNLIFPVVGVDAKGKRRIRLVKWSMPYGFNVFSYAGGQLAELAMVKKPDPTKFANNMGSAVVNAFSPVKFIEGMDGFKPHIMKIFDALGANEDDLGMPIRASDDFDRFDKPRAFSGRADTPEAYKSAAKALNAVGGGDEVTPPKVFKGLLDWAPEDLEFLTGQLTGGTGRFFADTYKVGEKLFAGVDTTPTDYPILRSLVGEVDQNRATQGIYYDRAEKIEREVERVRRVLYDGREQVGGRYKLDMAAKKKADELLRSTPELDGFKITRLRNGSYLDKSGSVEIKKASGLAKSYKVAQKEIDEIRAEIRAAQARTYPSLKEKLAEIRALQEKREAAQRKFSVSFAKRVQ